MATIPVTITPSPTPMLSPSASFTPTITPTITPTMTMTPTMTPSVTVSVTPVINTLHFVNYVANPGQNVWCVDIGNLRVLECVVIQIKIKVFENYTTGTLAIHDTVYYYVTQTITGAKLRFYSGVVFPTQQQAFTFLQTQYSTTPFPTPTPSPSPTPRTYLFLLNHRYAAINSINGIFNDGDYYNTYNNGIDIFTGDILI